MFVEFDRHHHLEIFCVFATGFVNFVDNPHDDIQAGRRFRFFDVVFRRFDALQRDAFASAGDVRKNTVFDRIIFRTIRRVMRDANFQLQPVRQRLRSLLEQILRRTVAAAAIAKNQ